MADIKNKQDLERWLEGKPVEVSRVIALRCALRVLPLYIDLNDYDTRYEKNAKFLQHFRCMSSSFAISFTNNISYTSYTNIAYQSQINSGFHYDKAIVWATLTACHHFDPSTATKFAVDSVYAAITTRVGLNEDNIIIDSAPVLWSSISLDCSKIDNGIFTTDLAQMPLWLDGTPQWFLKANSGLKAALHPLNQEWDVWTRWFDDRINGVKADAALEDRRVKIEFDDWFKGAEHVNALIRKMEEERAAELAAETLENTEIPPFPDFGPGHELYPTPFGFETVSTPVKMDEAVLAIQKSLHNLLLRRANRLDSEIARICNTHRSLRDEYEDYVTFIRVPFDEIDVTSIWSVGAALNDMVVRLERQFERAQTSTRPTDLDELPDEAILSQLTSLMRDHSGFIMGYDEALALNAKAAELRRLEILPQVLGEQAGAVLKPMLVTEGLLAEKPTRLVVALDRALNGVDDKTIAFITSNITIATKYVVSFVRAIMPYSLLLGPPVDIIMKMSGDPNWETLRSTMYYLFENRHAISAFATHNTEFARWFAYSINVIELAAIEELKNKKR